MTIQAGDKAPQFAAPASNGKTVTLDDFVGKWLVLYFYPKDETPGCTTEACNFRDSFSRIESLGVHVLGCSPDSVESHEKFISHHNLPFVLISDENHIIAESYGVWKERNMYGKKFMGVERSTFLINPEGRIQREWRKVKVDGHVDEIISEIQSHIN